MRDELGVEFPMERYGYLVLLKALVIPEVTKGGIYLTQSARNAAKREHNIGLVVGMGQEAFKDKERFPCGPKCKVGEWVFYAPYEKTDEHIGDNLCFFVNDERIMGPIPEADLPSIAPELRGPDWKSETKESI